MKSLQSVRVMDDQQLSEKRAAYLAAGTFEVWLVAEDGTIRFFDERGSLDSSGLGIALVLPH